MNEKLVIAMVGLPARGKSTMTRKIARTLELDDVRTRIFNNGDLRRRLFEEDTSHPEFFSPGNPKGVAQREQCARLNLDLARAFLEEEGQVAILDASNVTRRRRRMVAEAFPADIPVFFIECVNADAEALKANLERKASQQELSHLSRREAVASFLQRIAHYESIYEPLREEPNRLLVDSFENRILREQISDVLPYYDRIRDIITTRIVKNLYLVRHGETHANLEERIGGDADLTPHGRAQAGALADYFARVRIPIIFTSTHKRTLRTAAPIAARQEHCAIVALPEFDEIHAGICEGMTYREIQERLPEVAAARKRDKYDYVYPEGEGYRTMENRIHRGLKKIFYLTNYNDNIMIVGHRAVNRMILSDFVFRPKEEVPYIYMPQNRYYQIRIDPYKRIFALRAYAAKSATGA